MKIHDIVSESAVQEGPVDLLKAVGSGIATGAKWLAQSGSRSDLIKMMAKNSQIVDDALRGTAPTAAQIEAIYGPKAAEMFAKDPNFMAKVLKQFHIDDTAAFAASRAGTQTTTQTTQAATGPTSWVTRGLEKVTGNATSTATKAQYARAAEIAAEHYGSQTMKLFYALDITKEVINYNIQADKLDKNAPDYEEQLRTLRGKFITAVIAPKVTIWAANKLFLGKIASAVPWIIKQFPGNRSAELAAIVKQVGARGLEAALLVGFSTEAGKQWLVDTFGVMITGVGTIPELASWVGSTVKAANQVATGNLPSGFNKPASDIDLSDPFSIMNNGASGGRVDPFKGTGRGGQ